MEKDSNPTSANLIRKETWYFTKLWSPKMGVPSGIAGSSSTNNSNKCLSSGSSQPNLDLLYCRFSPARRQDSQFSYPKERMLLFPSSHRSLRGKSVIGPAVIICLNSTSVVCREHGSLPPDSYTTEYKKGEDRIVRSRLSTTTWNEREQVQYKNKILSKEKDIKKYSNIHIGIVESYIDVESYSCV